ncbi:hypothetical protein C8F01DRAFT_1369612 [Mycena amicta]|nr:hypothetical protein C8F01DRAFT_1369612 [Mycena amicta]
MLPRDFVRGRGRGQHARGGAPRRPPCPFTAHPILASINGTYMVNSQQLDGTTSRCEYYAPASPTKQGTSSTTADIPPSDSMPPIVQPDFPEAELGETPSLRETDPAEEVEAKRERVAHMEKLLNFKDEILSTLLENYNDDNLLKPCGCADGEPRIVRCLDCLQAPIVCRQCFLRQHRRAPTHWASVYNADEKFFEKTDISQVRGDSAVYLGHGGEFCEHALKRQHFTLVDTNGIHPTVISFCGCSSTPAWKQLLRAGIFPATFDSPQTGFTLRVLEGWREYRHQGHLSMWDFVHILQRLSEAWFPDTVPDFSKYFDNVSRVFHYLNTLLARGHKHGADDVLGNDTERAYPHRPIGYLGTVCAACPEPGVNMPLEFSVPKYLRHLVSEHITLDGNFKANLFYKRDNGTDLALTNGSMYFPPCEAFEKFAETYVVHDEDKEVPCKTHIGSIRNQGKYKYKNTRFSGVVASACDHALPAGLVDMIIGEAFPIVQYALTIHLRQKNSPPYPQTSQVKRVQCYDSFCSFDVNQLRRVQQLFPDEEWLRELVEEMEGQIPAGHINGHGPWCQKKFQPAYFPCHCHFHGESAETIWPNLNAFAPSFRQMNAGARQDSINFAMDIWNRNKILRLADQLGTERLEALHVAAENIAVFKQLSQQFLDRVVAWSKMSRLFQEKGGVAHSVYQHSSKTVATIDDVLESLRATKPSEHGSLNSTADWIRWGIDLEYAQRKIQAYVKAHREHPLQDTWNTICTLRDALTDELDEFRARQAAMLPELELSPLNEDSPENTIIQIPSHILRDRDTFPLDLSTIDEEIQLRCAQANNQILAVQDKSVTLSIVRSSRGYDYRGQGGITRAQRGKAMAEMLRDVEITSYMDARNALLRLGHMDAAAEKPFPPMKPSDTVRKDTHVFRMHGDSRIVGSSAWSLLSGSLDAASALEDISGHAMSGEVGELEEASDDDSALLLGTRTKKRVAGSRTSPAKRRKTTTHTPEKVDGWIWRTDAVSLPKETNDNVAAYKSESEQVQYFRSEAEGFRWYEQYERKNIELWRVAERFRYDSDVWTQRAERLKNEQRLKNERLKNDGDGDQAGAILYAREQAAMSKRLRDYALNIFRNTDSGGHRDWIDATSFEDLVTRIARSRDVLFNWMDKLGMERAYKYW